MAYTRPPGSAVPLPCENHECDQWRTCNKIPTAFKDCDPITSFRCPKCRSELRWTGSRWRCSSPTYCHYVTN